MNLNKLMKQAQKMQEQMAKTQAELEDKTVEVQAAGGKVTVVANGSGDVISIKIAKEIVDPEDVEFLEEAVLSGVKQAIAQGKELAQSEMTKITGGLGVTGSGFVGARRASSRVIPSRADGTATMGGAPTSHTSVEELLPQIFPQWIKRPHQRIFLFASPTLDLLFTCDGIANVAIVFVVNEAVQFVLLGETLNGSVLVLANATLEIIRHARVQDDSTAIGHHINEEGLHSICEVPRPAAAGLGMTAHNYTARSCD